MFLNVYYISSGSFLFSKLLRLHHIPLLFLFLVVTIPRPVKGANGKRIYDKMHWCVYCGKPQLKIGRHLREKHKDEDDVKELERIENKSRKMKLDLLRYRGDFHQNMKILKIGGELIVWRRPAAGDFVNYRDYLPCMHCLVFVTQAEMWRHLKTCQHKSKTDNNNLVSCSKLLLYPNQNSAGASVQLQELILDKMNNDDISKCVKNDKLITTYGSFLLGTTDGMKTANCVSQRMRVLARLLLCMRKKLTKPELCLEDVLKPDYFDPIVEATKEVGGYTMINNEGEIVPSFSTPSLPLLIGYALEKCVSLYRGIGIKVNDKTVLDNAKNFLKLFKLEWTGKITTLCHKTLDVNRFNKVQLLPFTEDLLKVREYMKAQMPVLVKELGKNPNLDTWRMLAEITGSRLTIFNRRRGNEVFNLLVKRFEERGKYKEEEMEEIRSSLSPLEKRLMLRYGYSHLIT